jgi:hypothetical protein
VFGRVGQGQFSPEISPNLRNMQKPITIFANARESTWRVR